MNLLGIDKSSHQHQKKRLVYDIRTLIENILKARKYSTVTQRSHLMKFQGETKTLFNHVRTKIWLAIS